MRKLIKSKFMGPLIVITVLALFLSSIPISASASGKITNNEEKGLLILEALKLNETKTNFSSFDQEHAKKEGLSSEEATNAKAVFLNLSNEEVAPFVQLKREIEGDLISTRSLKDKLKLASIIAGMVVVGQAVLDNLIKDLYTLGAKGFCKSWAGKYKPIKSACKSLGYVK
ncbi:hypothetical protein MST22_17450 [Virgibacillus halodenitrificans]|uniref:hypothetical protein n=1 Tax=Virgibacillus halodenitrificans TaxID=1482 RepID=UPI001FB309A1|nr:hypothetical protein [Virgibacillus halodenitrificans]MCJ0932940.1 hypothetical protein [Virgibacillus halodenitrificans]